MHLSIRLVHQTCQVPTVQKNYSPPREARIDTTRKLVVAVYAAVCRVYLVQNLTINCIVECQFKKKNTWKKFDTPQV
jgi:hypothetical protein